ncbi:hypothetical protein scyTo_0018655, partial [Scyliorhinus torazame]|nr:hypothetical protein [Scyliorhinus torazame]
GTINMYILTRDNSGAVTAGLGSSNQATSLHQPTHARERSFICSECEMGFICLSNFETLILQLLNGLGAPHQEAVLNCLKGRKEELKSALIEETNAVSSAQLQNFDWQLKLPLSSDKIAFLQTPLLNLDLDVRENGVLRPVSVEMDKEELQTLIHSLEAANKVVLQIK